MDLYLSNNNFHTLLINESDWVILKRIVLDEKPIRCDVVTKLQEQNVSPSQGVRTIQLISQR